MKEVKPVAKRDYGGFFLVEDHDGTLKCSCGRELVNVDEHTWRCSAGYPTYRFEEGTIMVDKFGNIMIKKIPHGDDENE